jgi:hypothetical protein
VFVATGVTGSCAKKSGFHGKVEKNSHVRRRFAPCLSVNSLDRLLVDTPSVALVSQGGIGKAVTQNKAAVLKSRADNFGYMLSAVGGKEHEFSC